MKKLVIIAIFKLLLPAYGHTQSNVRQKLLIREKPAISPFTKAGPVSFKFSFKNFSGEAGSGNSLLSFLNDQLIVKVPGLSKRPALIFTEFSFSDLMENAINGLNNGMINTYDDHISELFKDAPSLFTVKCIICF
jgi:hypothetical protein